MARLQQLWVRATPLQEVTHISDGRCTWQGKSFFHPRLEYMQCEHVIIRVVLDERELLFDRHSYAHAKGLLHVKTDTESILRVY